MPAFSSSSILPMFCGIFLPIFAAILVVDLANGCGLPPAPAAAPTCCCGGCGGGRKKREAVQPHYKGVEVPCPQTEWKHIMEGAILANDQSGSISAIQSGLFRRFPTEKFLVICASAKDSSISSAERQQNAIATKIDAAKQLPNAIHFSSAGDGYCNVLANGNWCQTVALSA